VVLEVWAAAVDEVVLVVAEALAVLAEPMDPVDLLLISMA
jgi:hypothetical protein